MTYLNDDFFLTTKTARELFHSVASSSPIIDFHTHLPQKEILSNKTYQNLWDLWLREDHYKWRLMRICGIDESFVSGEKSPWEKFLAFASMMPKVLGNPVHQWAHLELKRVFGIDTLLSADSAKSIWNETEQQLQSNPSLSTRGLLQKFQVQAVCTTDDPADDLSQHEQIASDTEITCAAYPTFRPDLGFKVCTPDLFQNWVQRLSNRVGYSIDSFEDLIHALKQRHDDFHDVGCRMSDHGPPHCPLPVADAEKKAEAIFAKVINGEAANSDEINIVTYLILKNVSRWNTEKGWTMQLHLGPQRNVNSKAFQQLGPDQGYDTMGSWSQTGVLIDFLDSLQKEDALPQLIVYNLNPNESASICCALQNFQQGPTAGKIQYGPAWWHLDHERGILEQLDWFTSLSALGCSLGMLTDSRSYTSFVRHEYYRRLLCRYIGESVEKGSMPNDINHLKEFVTNICYRNAQQYFQFPNTTTV